jgi:hypothetical protein
VQTRKAWRNRGPEAGERVLALLEALRSGLGVEAVGLFDDDRTDPERDPSPPNFWSAFQGSACAAIDWDDWYATLRRAGRALATCGCGAGHALSGFLIHGRWALLVLAPPVPPAETAAAVASALHALAAQLPPAKDREDPRARTAGPPGESDAPPREVEALVWWAGKDPQ